MSPVAEGLVAAELARADGGLRVFFLGHGLVMSIGLLGSAEQRRR
ncbi:MAG TPA: acyl-CoA dehydrogenase family protein [Pseudonocardiaceae bacterium]|jgi:alkylation response protein AidB-like acyl-CoA dehydrogenase|nr:acyl-CoA dehydrogenase family protein [Pseudonocardiaceae bacterium]